MLVFWKFYSNEIYIELAKRFFTGSFFIPKFPPRKLWKLFPPSFCFLLRQLYVNLTMDNDLQREIEMYEKDIAEFKRMAQSDWRDEGIKELESIRNDLIKRLNESIIC